MQFPNLEETMFQAQTPSRMKIDGVRTRKCDLRGVVATELPYNEDHYGNYE